MHLTDISVGALGSFAIVGAHLPIAWARPSPRSTCGTGGVSVCFFGDGATNIGAFHEVLNLASLWKLPVVFVCENNLYGEYSPIAATTPVEPVADRAATLRDAGGAVDGNDVLASARRSQDACAARARRRRPDADRGATYRHHGHSRATRPPTGPTGELEVAGARPDRQLRAR